MKIENHEIHEYENDNIMKTIKYTQEIHETMNLKTKMSENLWAVRNVWIWNRNISMKPKTEYETEQCNCRSCIIVFSLIQISHLNPRNPLLLFWALSFSKGSFSGYILQKSILFCIQSSFFKMWNSVHIAQIWIWKRLFHEIVNLKMKFSWNYENST